MDERKFIVALLAYDMSNKDCMSTIRSLIRFSNALKSTHYKSYSFYRGMNIDIHDNYNSDNPDEADYQEMEILLYKYHVIMTWKSGQYSCVYSKPNTVIRLTAEGRILLRDIIYPQWSRKQLE